MSRVRLWDTAFNFIAAEDDCPDPTPTLDDDIEITITGEGPIHDALKHHMRDASLLDDDLHITIDQDDHRRIGGKITAFGIETRRCECRSNDITTTTITAADPWLDPQWQFFDPRVYPLSGPTFTDAELFTVQPESEPMTPKLTCRERLSNLAHDLRHPITAAQRHIAVRYCIRHGLEMAPTTHTEAESQPLR